MKLMDYKKDNFKVLNLLGADVKALCVESVKYIDRLALLSNTEIKDWDIKALFGGDEGKPLVYDRNVINQRFFAHKATLTEPNPIDQIELPEVVHLAMLKAKQAATFKMNQPLLHNIREYEQNKTRYFNSIRDQDRHILENRMKIAENEAKSTLDLGYQIKKIIHEGFWGLWDMSESYVDFVNVNSLRCHHRNPLAGVDLDVDLGFIRIRMETSTFKLTMHSHQNNRISEAEGYEGRFHPHQYEDNTICFGTGKEIMSQCMAEGRIADLFTLLTQVMTQYNPDNPNVRLSGLMDIPPKNTIYPEKPTWLKAGEEYYWECGCGYVFNNAVRMNYEHCYTYEDADGDPCEQDHSEATAVAQRITRKIREQRPVLNPVVAAPEADLYRNFLIRAPITREEEWTNSVSNTLTMTPPTIVIDLARPERRT